MRRLLVVATRREARATGIGEDVLLVSGSGPGAGEAVRARITAGAPPAIIIAGVCGALDPSLRPGTLVLGRVVQREGYPELRPDRQLFDDVRAMLRQRKVRFVSSALLTVPAAIGSRASKMGLWNTYGAGGVDMESYWVAEAAEKAGAPWMVIRCVLDTAAESLPPSLRTWSGEGDEREILTRAATHPFEWPAFARLAVEWRAARRPLRRGARIALRAAEAGFAASGGPAHAT